ncbi:MAG: tyrosine-type recombinase/integrase [Homoserinimonas sp.]
MASITSYSTSAGKRYRVRYRTPDRRQTDKRGFKTKREAELFLASVEVSKAKGEFIEAGAARETLRTLGTVWLRHQSHLKPSSFRPVEIAWRLHVEPVWGDKPVGEIRHSAVQAWVTGLSGSATTVLRSYGVLASILDVAVRDRRIHSNPARGVNLPRKTGKARVYLTHEQVELLASHAGDKGTLVRFLAYTGLRWGEAVGLRVSHLDALRLRVNIRENAVMVGGQIVVGTPKSHEARSVPYPKFLSLPLAELCEGKGRDDILFGDGVSYMRPPDARRGWWVAALRNAQLEDDTFPKVTRHDLRHTAASLAVSAGANVKAVQRMLGHASAAMTLDVYADLFDDDLDAVGAALDHARTISNVGKMWANGTSGKHETP